MSAITLDDLRTDYLKVREALLDRRFEPVQLRLWNKLRNRSLNLDHVTVEEWAASPVIIPERAIKLYMKVRSAAKLYLIARDEGLKAAMLWKLSQP